MRRCAAIVSCVAAACAAPVASSPGPEPLHTQGVHARADPTLRGARLVPEALDVSAAIAEPSGGVRGIVQGTRFRVDVRGGVRTALDRIDDPSQVVPVPARLGGGFLLVAGDTVYKADDWLAQPRPFFRSLRGVSDAFVGLDRVYVRTKLGAHIGLDPRTGGMLDLGPWPADPFVGALRPLDGWRALAITDIRGVVGTTDAGHTWVALDLPIRAQSILPVTRDEASGSWVEVTPDANAEAFVVSDAAPQKATRPGEHPPPARCYLVSGTLAASPMPSCEEVTPLGHKGAAPTPDTSPLRMAIENGWPLEDRTAIVVLGSGSVERVSLDDGSLLEVVGNGFDHDLGPCHAVPLGSVNAPSAFGFVCGVAHAGTSLLAYDEATGRLRPLRRFATPRLVETSGTGYWLVHGSCRDDEGPASTSYCVGTPVPQASPAPLVYTWREVHVTAAPDAIATLTSSGDLARVTGSGDLGAATLTLTGVTGAVHEVPLRLAEETSVAKRILARGALQNGLEERTPGVLSGWIRVDGTVVGVDIGTDGAMRLGMSIRELGHPFVAGRYGLGWTRAHVAYETTDGGTTWTPFAAPAPLTPSTVRACGPMGCVVDGWLRVGWGEHVREPSPALRASPPPRSDGPMLRLTCRTIDPFPPRPPRRESAERRITVEISPLFGGTGPVVLFGRGAALGASRPDAAFEAPPIGHADHLFEADIFHAFDPSHAGLVGRVSAWGPLAGDWSGAGRWVTRWRAPFGGRSSVRATAVTAAPFIDADSARAALGVGPGGPLSFTAEVSEDAAHALVAVKRPSGQLELASADEGGTLSPVHRADGAPWGPIDAAIRVGPDWLIATPSDARHTSVELFRVSDGVGRRIASIPRLLFSWGPSSPPVRLAHADHGMVGIVVEGEGAADRSGASRWVVPVEIDTGLVAPPESLGAVDLGDRATLSICDDRSATGWELDTTWSSPNVTLDLGDANAPAYLQRMFARLRLSPDRACIDRLSAEVNADALEHATRSSAARTPSSRHAWEPTLPVSLGTTDAPEARALLACEQATK